VHASSLIASVACGRDRGVSRYVGLGDGFAIKPIIRKDGRERLAWISNPSLKQRRRAVSRAVIGCGPD